MSHWERQRKREFYYQEAKKAGYRSRAAFKLIQIQRKFNVFKKGNIVLDLGAAPGGWTQVAYNFVSPIGKVYAVDLEYLEPIEGVLAIKGDITDPKLKKRLRRLIGKPVDVIISDMSPKITGNWSTDHARQIYLSELAFKLCLEDFLVWGGKFVCKLFQGDLFEQFVENLKKVFQFVYLYKPKASRKSSAEIYAIAKGFTKGPTRKENNNNNSD
ncbi:MAG: 23S rRNA (uridine(2552)-2'-O)-methyltransferase [Candidatus Heimdallarchaeota archaeon]|nr:23S rRNA (uridine(2552)-2'-O)-methyltransferase [Candidatus Heimdallarchaeota archaeon]